MTKKKVLRRMVAYKKWMDANVVGSTYGRCKEVTLQMQEAFPLLTRVRGHYHCAAWGRRAHWWLLDPAGFVIDPTADQFPSGGSGVYEPWDESLPEPTGRCWNCSEHCFNGEAACSDECRAVLQKEYDSYGRH